MMGYAKNPNAFTQAHYQSLERNKNKWPIKSTVRHTACFTASLLPLNTQETKILSVRLRFLVIRLRVFTGSPPRVLSVSRQSLAMSGIFKYFKTLPRKEVFARRLCFRTSTTFHESKFRKQPPSNAEVATVGDVLLGH